MDPTQVINEIGGGLPAVVIVGLGLWAWFREKRINHLTDMFIKMNGDNISAMQALTSAVKGQGD